MEESKGITAEDILGDGQNYLTTEAGAKLRKGSITAAIANAKILTSENPVKLEGPNWEELKKISQSVLKPMDFYEIFSWKNSDIRYALTTDKQKTLAELQKANLYNPTMNPSKEDTLIWNDIIKQLKGIQGTFPEDPRYIKMLKLMEVHSCWFHQ